MRKYLKCASMLMALLMAITFCAAAEETALDREGARGAVFELGNGVDTGEASGMMGEALSDGAGITMPEAVEPQPEETEFVFGEEDSGDEADLEDSGNADAEPTATPEPEQSAPAVTPEASDVPEASENPETFENPEASESPETSENPEASEAPEAVENPVVSESTAAPEILAEAEPAVVMEGSADVSEKLAAEAEAAQNPAIVKLGVGEKYTLPAMNGTEAPVYTSANRKIATVTTSGVVKGKKRGTTTVVVTGGGTSVEYTVQVVRAPKKIKFTKKKLTLGYDAAQNLGEQGQLKTKLSAGSSSRITYYGYNKKVVSVSSEGVVTAVGVGTTKVTARTYNKKKAKIKIVVRSAPGSLALKTTSLNLGVGTTYAMKWTLPKKTASAIHFSSDNPGCVSVNEKGVLTALAVGTANVTYGCFNGVQSVCTVNVLPAPEPINLAFSAISMGLKEKSAPILGSADPSAVCGGVTFTSSNKKVATVTAQGVIKAKKRGSATIRIKGGNGSKASVKVKVYKAPTKVTLNAKVLSLEPSGGARLKAKLPKNQAGSITFTSSKTNVAQVDAGGYVIAVGEGTAVITARTYNGKKAKCTVEVYTPDVEISMADVAHINTAGYTYFPIEAVTTTGKSYNGTIQVSIDPGDVAVYENGRLLGKRGGQTAVLTAQVGGSSRTCVIIVEDSAKARPVKAIAHRGSIHWPENSLEAFRYFSTTGADAVELDIRSTSDGVQVVFHDATYYAAGVQHTVSQETYATMKAQVPSLCTLDEALDVIAKSDKEIYMNPKDTADGAKCVKAIRDRGLQSKTLYFCNSETLLKQIYGADSSATLGYSLSKGSTSMSDELLSKAKDLHIAYIVPHYTLVNQSVVDYWHGNGYKVCAWTVNDKSRMKTLCNMGVDGILTDYPEYCVEARAAG